MTHMSPILSLLPILIWLSSVAACTAIARGSATESSRVLADYVHRALTENAVRSVVIEYNYDGTHYVLRFARSNRATAAVIGDDLRTVKADVVFRGTTWFGRDTDRLWFLDAKDTPTAILTIVPQAYDSHTPTNVATRISTVIDDVVAFNEWPYGFMRLGLPGCDGAPYVFARGQYLNTNRVTRCVVSASLTECTADHCVFDALLTFPSHTAKCTVHVRFRDEAGHIRPTALTIYASASVDKASPYITATYLRYTDESDEDLLAPDVQLRPGLGTVVDYRPGRPVLRDVSGAKDVRINFGPLVLTTQQLQVAFWVFTVVVLAGLSCWRVARRGKNASSQ